MSIVSGNKVDYKTLIDALPSVKIPNYAFRNMGNFGFQNVAGQWGLGTPSFSNGSAYGDLDNDGDLDLVVNNVNMPVFIYRNEAGNLLPDNHYLKVILNGEPGNTQAIGAKITVRHNGKSIYLEQMPMRGFLSTSDPRPNLGLGSLTMVDSLIVEWPDNRTTLMTNVKTDQTLSLYQKDATIVSPDLQGFNKDKNRFFTDISAENRISCAHREDDFNDFEREKLLYHMMSTEGPGMCQGDINGDGLEDIFVCGAKGQPGALLIQHQNGTFESVEKCCLKLIKFQKTPVARCLMQTATVIRTYML
jgi:hypothetical protein